MKFSERKTSTNLLNFANELLSEKEQAIMISDSICCVHNLEHQGARNPKENDSNPYIRSTLRIRLVFIESTKDSFYLKTVKIIVIC